LQIKPPVVHLLYSEWDLYLPTLSEDGTATDVNIERLKYKLVSSG
jgi:hypothetical protein